MKKIFEKIKKKIQNNRFLFRWYLLYLNNQKHEYKNMRLKYNPLDISDGYYKKISSSNNQELEHQIGRLNNFRKIIAKINTLPGDVVEFGAWRGFSLLWIAYFMEREAIFNKKIVGIDGFVGLPYSDGVFTAGGFSDTSLKLCRNNLINSKEIYPETKANIYIGKYLYRDKSGVINYLKGKKIKKFCFIHIDCDVAQSFKEVIKILLDGNLIADKCYVLIDDYGCNSKLKNTINTEFKKMSRYWEIRPVSKTKYTKNFILVYK